MVACCLLAKERKRSQTRWLVCAAGLISPVKKNYQTNIPQTESTIHKGINSGLQATQIKLVRNGPVVHIKPSISAESC